MRKIIRALAISTVLSGMAVAVATRTAPQAGAGTRPTRPPQATFSVKEPYRAPELAGLAHWVNAPRPLTLASLRGKVVIVDFWTFGCVNCQRTLPHVKALYAKYRAQGLEVLGVHAPEFGYERDPGNVRAAIAERGITWPVAQDDDFATWRRYGNRAWPAFYFVDRAGNVRHVQVGEGRYDNNDAVVAALLAERR
jgi:thiol-disulfide isomerase/thioredoxin